jgi:branched-chain amino acid transport system permease protein
MTLFWDYTLNGIANGMIYAAMALALVLIYRATRIINFAQGAAGMLTTFIAFSLLSRGLGYWWAFVLVLVIGFAIGAATQRILIRPLQGKSELNPAIVTIGLLVVFEGLAGAIYGNASRGFPAAYSQRGIRIGHTTIAFSDFDVFILVAVLLLMTATLILFRFTSLGLRMRATAFSREIARLLGVRVGILLTLGWGLAGIAGSLAGLLVAPTSSFGPYYMDLILVYGFTAAVIGGLESPVGALVGGLISGLCISWVGGYLGSGLEPLGALALLMLALMLRPEGIFARPPARRV